MKKKILRISAVICSIVIGMSLGLSNAVFTKAEHTVIQDGLVAYWNLDDGSGNTAAEMTGTVGGRELAVEGTTQWVDGKYGKAFYFDGKTVLAMDGAKAIKVYNLTVSFWAKVDDFPQSDTGANLFVVNSDLAAIDTGAFDFGFFGKGLYAYVVNNFAGGTGDRVSHGVDISSQITGKWQHFAVVYDTDEGKEFAKIYLNGSEVASSKLTSILGLQIKLGYRKTAAYPKNCALNFGGYTDTAGVVQRAIKGAMDDIAIYDRALTTDEIKQLAGVSSQQSSKPSSSISSSKISSSAAISSSILEKSSTESYSEGLSEEESAISETSSMSQKSEISSMEVSAKSSSEETSEDDDDRENTTLIIVIIIVAALLLAGGIGWLIYTRKK